MARKLKTNGIYAINCILTGEPAGTTPAVFTARAGRYGVTVDVLKQNYIGRTGAKLLKTLVNEKGMPVPAAIKAIRDNFKVTNTNAIADTIVQKIVSKVSAKVAKSKKTAAFKATKEAAMKALLGTPAVKAPAVTAPASK